MFLEFFGMREQPFGVTPDPRFLYLSPAHREALASLYYGIEAGRGFLAMIAQPGMGKTTLLFQLLEEFRNAARTAFLFQTQCDSRELIRFLLAELGIETKEQDPVKMHEEFNSVLLREMKAGKRFVVVIDEAQNLDDSVLETVRLLSNFETPRTKLMQIILSGQPELADKLSQPNLSQLRQRISIVARLGPLNPQHVHDYIQHRLRLSGYVGPRLLLPDAESAIIERSEGIPRTINNLCFNALSLAYALGKRQIERAIIEEISGDLDLGSIATRPRAPQFSIPFNSPIFSHTPQWNFDDDVKASAPKQEADTPSATTAESPERETISTPSTADSELKQMLEQVRSTIKTNPAPINGNGTKPMASVATDSVAAIPAIRPIFTQPVTTTQPAPKPQPRPVTPAPAPQVPFAIKKAPSKTAPSGFRRFAKPLIFGVLAIDIALGAIFVLHQGDDKRSGSTSSADVASIPESTANNGTLVTDETEHLPGRVPMRVSVPESTMRNHILRMVPATKPEGVKLPERESVLLRATVGRDGHVLGARLLSGDEKLAKAATDAVKQWRYKPYLVDGQPADVETQITVNFNPSDNRPAR
jgi:general secretion pathway protein A